MLLADDLYNLAKDKFEAAKLLHSNGRNDTSVYLCGYAIELMLKRRVVITLGWDGYPETNQEFDDLKSFRIHKLDTLLKLSGVERVIRTDSRRLALWQIVSVWDPEIRYKRIGSHTTQESQNVIDATREIINSSLLK